MDKKISVSEESLVEINKAMNLMVEETYALLTNVNRAIESAEMDGWTDNKFVKFRDEFMNAERLYKEGNQYLEDILLPELKRIQIVIEGY